MTRTKSARALRVTSVALAGALTLAACGLAGSDETPDAGTGNQGAGELSGKISFQTWNLKAGFGEYFTGLIDDFTAEHPDVTIDWVDQPADGYSDKLQADATTGNLPDVVNVTPDLAYPLAKAGVLMDITKAAPDAESDFLPNAWEDYTFPGMEGAYAFPWYLNTGPMFYNKKLFREAGLDPEDPPTNFDELYDQAMKMGQSAQGKFYMLGAMPSIGDFGTYGIPLLNEDGTEFVFNTPEAVKIVEAYQDMYENDGLLPDATVLTYTGTGERFLSGQVAFTGGSAYDLENFKNNAPELYANIGITPAITNTGSANMFSQGIAVKAQTKNPDAAVAFAQFVTNAENQEAFAKIVNIFPSTEGSLDDPYFTEDDGTDTGAVRVAAAEQLKNAVNYTPVVWTEEMRVALQRELSDALQGRKSAKDALDDAVAEANKLLEQLG